MPTSSSADLPARFFKQRGWKPFAFQKDCWAAFSDGKSGLLHAPTGLGKTLAVWLGPVAEAAADGLGKNAPCTVLWITPLRALAADTLRALQEPLTELDLPYTVAARTGDTSSYKKTQLRKKLPFALVTTPESLSLMLTHEDFREKLHGLKTIVIDEWHELLGTKRGVQTELCLARLRAWIPGLRIWGLSATLGNTTEAAQVLLGETFPQAEIVSGDLKKKIEIRTIMPRSVDRFPWSGHIGTALLKPVVRQLEKANTTLLFTNTRSQTEIWFQELIHACPDWAGQIAVHHGSIDREERDRIEQGLHDGSLRCVVCTSSLDLGVDFAPVEQVIQVGSPKGIARILQRAGRSGHQPGKVSKIYCVPSNALELLEFAAARDNITGGPDGKPLIEARIPLQKPLDVLVQHLVTVAIGEPCQIDKLRTEITSTYAYRELTDDEWDWAIGFITTGGKVLSNYPNYHKATLEKGLLHVTDKRVAQLQRMSIGTITADPVISVKFTTGKTLGTCEEWFISKIPTGGQFIFGGRRLELVRFRNQIATVKAATKRAKGQISMWVGSRMPISNEMATAVAKRMHENPDNSPETARISPILTIQKNWSRLPSREYLLLEHCESKEGFHVFVFPLAGRMVHEGLGTLAASRLTHSHGNTVTVTMNDYGFSLTSPTPIPFEEDDWRILFSTNDLLADLIQCMNTAELSKRQFREIARVAGLITQTIPGKKRTNKDLQTSSSLLYDVFRNYDPENLLLQQAEREILERQLELTRLQTAMKELENQSLHFVRCEKLTPFAFPLWAERLNATTTGESYTARLAAMLEELETAADTLKS